jgi:cell division protein FtsI (penicillin-binding protein 3)
VAGKTGTAQKADPVSGGYSADKHFSSFVGFAPAEAPRLAIGVFIDEPKGEIYGGEVAAPVFRDVAEHALKASGVPPSGTAVAAHPFPANAGPPGTAGSAGSATEGDEASPVPLVEFAPRKAPRGTGGVAVPALQGLAARSALRRLESADLAGDLRGTGRVTAQVPRAGEVVERGTRIRLTLAPPG